MLTIESSVKIELECILFDIPNNRLLFNGTVYIDINGIKDRLYFDNENNKIDLYWVDELTDQTISNYVYRQLKNIKDLINLVARRTAQEYLRYV